MECILFRVVFYEFGPTLTEAWWKHGVTIKTVEWNKVFLYSSYENFPLTPFLDMLDMLILFQFSAWSISFLTQNKSSRSHKH